MDNVEPLTSDTIAELQKYSACDISDALLKLKAPGAGFIADLIPYSPLPGNQAFSPVVTIAPVSTVLFVPKGEAVRDDGSAANWPAPNIPQDVHWSDLTVQGTFVVLKQPPGQTNAVCGGIMALRMKVRQVRGVVVAGRVRDLDELRSTGLPVSVKCLELSSR